MNAAGAGYVKVVNPKGRTYPYGYVVGNEELIIRWCVVTAVPWQFPGSFIVKECDGHGNFPWADEEGTTMIARWLHPGIAPQINDPYTCLFKRDIGMRPRTSYVPYELVTGGLTEGHSLPHGPDGVLIHF